MLQNTNHLEIQEQSENLFDIILAEFAHDQFTLDDLKQSHGALTKFPPTFGKNNTPRKKQMDYLVQMGLLNKNSGTYSVNYESADVMNMVIGEHLYD